MYLYFDSLNGKEKQTNKQTKTTALYKILEGGHEETNDGGPPNFCPQVYRGRHIALRKESGEGFREGGVLVAR